MRPMTLEETEAEIKRRRVSKIGSIEVSVGGLAPTEVLTPEQLDLIIKLKGVHEGMICEALAYRGFDVKIKAVSAKTMLARGRRR